MQSIAYQLSVFVQELTHISKRKKDDPTLPNPSKTEPEVKTESKQIEFIKTNI